MKIFFFLLTSETYALADNKLIDLNFLTMEIGKEELIKISSQIRQTDSQLAIGFNFQKQ